MSAPIKFEFNMETKSKTNAKPPPSIARPPLPLIIPAPALVGSSRGQLVRPTIVAEVAQDKQTMLTTTTTTTAAATVSATSLPRKNRYADRLATLVAESKANGKEFGGAASSTSGFQHHFPRVMIVNPMHIVNLSENTKSRFVKLAEALKRLSEKWFSHVLLLAFLAIYACAGAYLFLNFEAKTEDNEKQILRQLKYEIVQDVLFRLHGLKLPSSASMTAATTSSATTAVTSPTTTTTTTTSTTIASTTTSTISTTTPTTSTTTSTSNTTTTTSTTDSPTTIDLIVNVTTFPTTVVNNKTDVVLAANVAQNLTTGSTIQCDNNFSNDYNCFQNSMSVNMNAIKNCNATSLSDYEYNTCYFLTTKLDELESRVFRTCSSGLTSSTAGDNQWTFWGALVYSMTVITTIGYGHITPVTFSGRLATMIYAIFGIPILLMVLADLGKLLTRIIKFIFKKTRNAYRKLMGKKATVRTRRLIEKKKSQYLESAQQFLSDTKTTYISPTKQRLIDSLSRNKFAQTLRGRRRRRRQQKLEQQCQQQNNDHTKHVANEDVQVNNNIDSVITPINDGRDEHIELTPIITTPPGHTKPRSPNSSHHGHKHNQHHFHARRRPSNISDTHIQCSIKIDDSDTTKQITAKDKLNNANEAIEIERLANRFNVNQDADDDDDEFDGQISEQLNNQNEDDDDELVDEEEEEELDIPVSFALFLLVAYMMAGAVVFSIWESWNFFDSIYFVFISMSTIGFGDLVPQQPKRMVGTFVYLMFGLALTSMCINVVQEKIRATFLRARIHLGEKMGFDVEHIIADDPYAYDIATTPTAYTDNTHNDDSDISNPVNFSNASATGLVVNATAPGSNRTGQQSPTGSHRNQATPKLKASSFKVRRKPTFGSSPGTATPTASTPFADKRRLSQRSKDKKQASNESVLAKARRNSQPSGKQASKSKQQTLPTTPTISVDKPKVLADYNQPDLSQTQALTASSPHQVTDKSSDNANQASLIQRPVNQKKIIDMTNTSRYFPSGAVSEGNSRRNSVSHELNELDLIINQLSKSKAMTTNERFAPLLGVHLPQGIRRGRTPCSLRLPSPSNATRSNGNSPPIQLNSRRATSVIEHQRNRQRLNTSINDNLSVVSGWNRNGEPLLRANIRLPADEEF